MTPDLLHFLKSREWSETEKQLGSSCPSHWALSWVKGVVSFTDTVVLCVWMFWTCWDHISRLASAPLFDFFLPWHSQSNRRCLIVCGLSSEWDLQGAISGIHRMIDTVTALWLVTSSLDAISYFSVLSVCCCPTRNERGWLARENKQKHWIFG